MEHWDGSRINEKKDILAYELTALVHGTEEADKARQASLALFSGEGDDSSMPTTTLAKADVPDTGILVIDLMLTCGLGKSKGEIRRLIQQGGVTIDGQKIDSLEAVVTPDALANGVKIRKGKKIFHRALLG